MFFMSPHHPAGKKVWGILADTIECCGLMIHSQLGSAPPTSLPSLGENLSGCHQVGILLSRPKFLDAIVTYITS
jgi:hypothetical protein